MGWLFGRKREAQDANEMLRHYNEAEAARLAAMTADGAAVRPAGDLSTAVSATEFEVEDVFTITGRGRIATGKVRSGILRVDDVIDVVREGAVAGTTSIKGIEMFRKRASEATVGELAGILLSDPLDVRRGDVIRPAASA
ncbi:EF-Tu/IF-2/RF-3 family GTPase [Microbacterium sp. CR_7]|uniref:EF-Tu/IF-2/RF-3 family GTPase n=1 Tax=Microbacterium sp. CR_7 TaxID=3055792 RepID=UPI0035C0015C